MASNAVTCTAVTRLALLADADVGVRRSKQVIGSDVPRLLEPPSARLGRVARGTPGGLGRGQSAGRGGGGSFHGALGVLDRARGARCLLAACVRVGSFGPWSCACVPLERIRGTVCSSGGGGTCYSSPLFFALDVFDSG